MINANSNVVMNLARIAQLSQASVTALEQTAEALHTEIVQAQVVPRDTGNLQNESMFVDMSDAGKGTVNIVHSTPYARRLYYHPEYNFSTKENPNAGAEWFEDWIKGGSKADFAPAAYAKLYKNLGGV
jgi:hypothetical protein